MNELIKKAVDFKHKNPKIDDTISEIPDVDDNCNNINRNVDSNEFNTTSDETNDNIDIEEELENNHTNTKNTCNYGSDAEGESRRLGMKPSDENEYDEEGGSLNDNYEDEEDEEEEEVKGSGGAKASTPNGDVFTEEEFLNEQGSEDYEGEEGEFNEAASKFSGEMTPSQIMYLQAK
jgi:hypothetical protein